MDRSKDKVGYEVAFTKYFYEYRPPRALKAILSDLEALDREADKLQAELHLHNVHFLDKPAKCDVTHTPLPHPPPKVR
jgi:hypothetical protein